MYQPPDMNNGYQQAPQGMPFQGQTPYQQMPPQGTAYQQGMPPYQQMPPQGTAYQQGMPSYQQMPPQGTAYQQGMPPYQQMPPQGTAYQQGMPPYQQMPPQGTAYQQGMPPYQQMPPQDQDGQGTLYQQMQGGPVQPPRPRRHITLFQVVAVLCALAVAGWYLYTTFAPEHIGYATIQAGMLGARYSGDALIVRNETPFDAEGVTSIKYSAEEGRTVARGMDICEVYSSGFSTRETKALQEYRDQIRDYQLSLLSAETTYDGRLARVESDVLARAGEVRQILAGTRGNLNNQEKLLNTAITARQQYLKQKYADDQRMSRLYDDERAQQQRIDSWTKKYAAAQDTIVSFYSDGYEYGLTINNYEQFTPSEVRSMIRGAKPAGSEISKTKTTIYRTIRDGSWAVLMLVRDQNWNPVEGQVYELQLEHFENTTVNATVQSFTRSGGELLVRLQVNSSVTPVLYMRTCQAELGDYIATMMVPARAIYTQDEMQGVVIVDGSYQAFVPVQIVYQDGDNVYVTAITQGLLFEGQTVRLF